MRKLLALAAACFVALSLFVIPAHAGSGFTFNCWTGVTEQGNWDANGEYDCATVNVGAETDPVDTTRIIHDRVCRTHHREGASGITKYRTFCIAVNQKQVDTCLCGKHEALLSWEHDPYRSTHIAVQIDWIRLINSENGAVLKYKNDVGWLTCDSSCNPDAYGTSHDSWYQANCDSDTIHIYAKARYRIKWLDLAGDPVGTYKTMQSTVYVGDC